MVATRANNCEVSANNIAAASSSEECCCAEALPFGSQGRPNKNGNTSSANEQLRANNKALMQGYHFALVMENSLGESYVTEKIATAFISGAIPIYYGSTARTTSF
eukprot:COSAG05_NODE_572_length_8615_cov_58.796031_7_plen_105_part_00